jgi:hypothetical protein
MNASQNYWLRKIERSLSSCIDADVVADMMARIEAPLRKRVAKSRKIPITISDRQEAPMPSPSHDISKGAAAYSVLVDLEKVKHPNLSMSQIHDRVWKSERGAQVLADSLEYVRKMNSPDGSSLAPQESGGVYYPPQVNEDHSGANQRGLQGAGHVVDQDEPAARRFAKTVAAKIAGGMTRSKAIDHTMREDTDGWKAYKNMPASSDVHMPSALGRDDGNSGRSPTMLPRKYS